MIQLHLVLFEGVECLLEVVQMGKLFLTLDEHIIYVYFHIPTDLFAEHLVH